MRKLLLVAISRGPIFRSAGTGMLATQANHFSKHLEARQNTSLRVVFSTLFSFENVAKRGLSCLMLTSQQLEIRHGREQFHK